MLFRSELFFIYRTKIGNKIESKSGKAKKGRIKKGRERRNTSDADAAEPGLFFSQTCVFLIICREEK